MTLYCSSKKVLSNEHKWFKNYITNRKPVVNCHGKVSKLYHITVGLPHRSVLGPVLFIFFYSLIINDITQSVNSSSCNIFADYVVIYTTGKNIDDVNQMLQCNINNISRWYGNSRLHINPNKT